MSLCIPTVELNLSAQTGSDRKNRVDFRHRVNTIIFDPNNKLRVYLISSRKDREKWKLPGGGMEEGEIIPNTAHRETLEEAGVSGNLTDYLGEFKNDKKKTKTYLCVIQCSKIQDDWLESCRNRNWFTIYEAFYLLDGEDKQMLLTYAMHTLTTGY